MKNIGDWLASCRDTPEAEFVAANPFGFLLHSAQHGPLVEVDVSAGMTLNRAVLSDESGPVTVTRESMFQVFSIAGVGERIVVGSSPDCDVVVNDESISARHAELRQVDGEVRLADAGSTLGTQVEGHTLEIGEDRKLSPGTKVTLGSVELMYLPAARFRLFVTELLS